MVVKVFVDLLSRQKRTFVFLNQSIESFEPLKEDEGVLKTSMSFDKVDLRQVFALFCAVDLQIVAPVVRRVVKNTLNRGRDSH